MVDAVGGLCWLADQRHAKSAAEFLDVHVGGADQRVGLRHASADQRAALALDLDGDDAHAGLEADQVDRRGARDHPGRAEHGVPGKGDLLGGCEDAQPRGPAFGGALQERRLRQVRLARQRLHRGVVDPVGAGEHRERIALERRGGEDVDDHVAKRAHVGTIPRTHL